MARVTQEEKLLKEISILDDTLYTLEHKDTEHIKNIYFNAIGQHFFIARPFEGKLYTQLNLKAVDVTGDNPYPKDEHIVFVPDTGSPSTVTAHCAPEDVNCHIVKTLTKADAIKHYEKLFADKKEQLEDLQEKKRPVVKSEPKKKTKTTPLNTRYKKAS